MYELVIGVWVKGDDPPHNLPTPLSPNGTRTGTRQCLRDRYQALSPVPDPVPGSVTGTGTTEVLDSVTQDPTGTEFRTRTGTGTTSAIRYRDQNRYQALSPVPRPVPGSVAGTRTGTRQCHRFRDRYQALSPVPEPVPGSVTGTGTRLCKPGAARVGCGCRDTPTQLISRDQAIILIK